MTAVAFRNVSIVFGERPEAALPLRDRGLAVNGLNPVARGGVLIGCDGQMVSVTRADRKTLRDTRLNRISMVVQQFGLLPWRSVRENVGPGLEPGGVPARVRAERVDRQLAPVGLTDWADRKVGELSGRSRRRSRPPRRVARRRRLRPRKNRTRRPSPNRSPPLPRTPRRWPPRWRPRPAQRRQTVPAAASRRR